MVCNRGRWYRSAINYGKGVEMKMILADKIIDERKKNGWSQEELADKLGVSRQSVSKWEGAQSVPDLQRILEMSKLFGVSTDYLLTGTDNTNICSGKRLESVLRELYRIISDLPENRNQILTG